MTADSDKLVAKSAKGHIASRVRSKSAASQSPADLFKRLRQIVTEQSKVALNAARAANQNMISTADPKFREDFAGKRTKAPLHPVAYNGIADFFGNRNAKPHRRIIIAAITHQQNKSVVRRAFG